MWHPGGHWDKHHVCESESGVMVEVNRRRSPCLYPMCPWRHSQVPSSTGNGYMARKSYHIVAADSESLPVLVLLVRDVPVLAEWLWAYPPTTKATEMPVAEVIGKLEEEAQAEWSLVLQLYCSGQCWELVVMQKHCLKWTLVDELLCRWRREEECDELENLFSLRLQDIVRSCNWHLGSCNCCLLFPRILELSIVAS